MTTSTINGSDVMGRVQSWARSTIHERPGRLAALIVVIVVGMAVLNAMGMTSGTFNSDYLASSLINVVPLALLALAELFVITSGRGGIDLSVGSMVSLVGMGFGITYAQWGWPLFASILVAILFGAVLGAFNGWLTAYLGFPALITTLATYYGYRSLALVITGSSPISDPSVQEFYGAAQAIELPLIGSVLPLFPLGLFTFLLPVAVVAWFVLNRTTYGRSLYAIGTNDTAAAWAGLDTRRTRMIAFVASGAISGLVAVYTVAQFASARPDAGSSMALPAITIAVLGGVAITGGVGRLAGVLVAALLIVWLNASILLVVPGNSGAQVQLLALGLVLLAASLLGERSKSTSSGGGGDESDDDPPTTPSGSEQ